MAYLITHTIPCGNARTEEAVAIRENELDLLYYIAIAYQYDRIAVAMDKKEKTIVNLVDGLFFKTGVKPDKEAEKETELIEAEKSAKRKRNLQLLVCWALKHGVLVVVNGIFSRGKPNVQPEKKAEKTAEKFCAPCCFSIQQFSPLRE